MNSGWTLHQINSLAPGRFQINFRHVIFKLTLVNGGWGIYYEISLRWMPDLTDDKSTLVQVMAWCRQANKWHYFHLHIHKCSESLLAITSSDSEMPYRIVDRHLVENSIIFNQCWAPCGPETVWCYATCMHNNDQVFVRGIRLSVFWPVSQSVSRWVSQTRITTALRRTVALLTHFKQNISTENFYWGIMHYSIKLWSINEMLLTLC